MYTPVHNPPPSRYGGTLLQGIMGNQVVVSHPCEFSNVRRRHKNILSQDHKRKGRTRTSQISNIRALQKKQSHHGVGQCRNRYIRKQQAQALDQVGNRNQEQHQRLGGATKEEKTADK